MPKQSTADYDDRELLRDTAVIVSHLAEQLSRLDEALQARREQRPSLALVPQGGESA
jgi:hypothetical protein